MWQLVKIQLFMTPYNVCLLYMYGIQSVRQSVLCALSQPHQLSPDKRKLKLALNVEVAVAAVVPHFLTT